MNKTRLGVSWVSEGRAQLPARGVGVEGRADIRVPTCGLAHLQGESTPKNPKDPGESASSADTCQGGPWSSSSGKADTAVSAPSVPLSSPRRKRFLTKLRGLHKWWVGFPRGY